MKMARLLETYPFRTQAPTQTPPTHTYTNTRARVARWAARWLSSALVTLSTPSYREAVGKSLLCLLPQQVVTPAPAQAGEMREEHKGSGLWFSEICASKSVLCLGFVYSS